MFAVSLMNYWFQFSRYKDGEEFTTYETISSGDDSGDFVSKISFDIVSTSAGTYKCTAVYYDDECPTEKSFNSTEITMSIIEAVAIENPEAATVLENSDHTFVCIFPDPFGDSQTPDIVWSFNDEVILFFYFCFFILILIGYLSPKLV